MLFRIKRKKLNQIEPGEFPGLDNMDFEDICDALNEAMCGRQHEPPKPWKYRAEWSNQLDEYCKDRFDEYYFQWEHLDA